MPASVAPYIIMSTMPATSVRPIIAAQPTPKPAFLSAATPQPLASATPAARSLAEVFQLLAEGPGLSLVPGPIPPQAVRLS